MYHDQFLLFTTKSTKDTKVPDIFTSELRALRVLRGESSSTVNPELRDLNPIGTADPIATRVERPFSWEIPDKADNYSDDPNCLRPEE